MKEARHSRDHRLCDSIHTHSGKSKTVKTENSSVVAGSRDGGREDGNGAAQESPGGEDTVLCLKCDGHFTTGCTCRSSHKCMLTRVLYSIEIIPQ